MALKYKVGDKVRIKSKFHFCSVDGFNNINMKDEFFNEYSRLPYCETIMTIGIVNKDFYILKEDRWAYKWTDEMIECKVEEETKNNNDMEEKENLLGWVKESNNLRLVPHKDYEIKHDGDNFYLVKKKKEYPKTYEECIGKLPINWDGKVEGYKCDLLTTFQKLLICRDAYWKIAGEEMGLGKSWELSIGTPIYYIYYNRIVGTIKNDYADDIQGNIILAFPTKEMRDAFYEAFREEIEICKELL